MESEQAPIAVAIATPEPAPEPAPSPQVVEITPPPSLSEEQVQAIADTRVTERLSDLQQAEQVHRVLTETLPEQQTQTVARLQALEEQQGQIIGLLETLTQITIEQPTPNQIATELIQEETRQEEKKRGTGFLAGLM